MVFYSVKLWIVGGFQSSAAVEPSHSNSPFSEITNFKDNLMFEKDILEDAPEWS